MPIFSDAGKTLDVLVEVEVGQGRCRVAPGAPCAALASRIASSDALHFAGIQCYSGWNQHVSKLGLRTEKTDGVVAMVEECLAALATCGLKAELVTVLSEAALCSINCSDSSCSGAASCSLSHPLCLILCASFSASAIARFCFYCLYCFHCFHCLCDCFPSSFCCAHHCFLCLCLCQYLCLL